MKKKMVLMILSMFLVAIVSVMGTLAYLTDMDSAVNTFAIGQVHITLDETAVDENGVRITDDEGNPVDRVKGNEYHLIPGQTYVKDPTVTVEEDSESAYIRMILTVHNASAVHDILEKYELGDFSVLIGDWDKEIWLYHDFTEDTEENTISFEFRYKEIVAAPEGDKKLDPLFTTLLVPGEVSNEELQELSAGGFKMVIHGHAIQAAGFADEEAAWAAFDAQIEDVAEP